MGLGSVFFAITFCVLIGGCAGFSTEKAVEDFGNPLAIIIGFSIFLIPLAIFVFLLFYRRTLYVDDSLFRLSIRGKKIPRKCKICGKHPLSQKYHAKKLHNLHIVNLEENYDDCGCSLCYERKTDWKKSLEP